MQSFLSNTSALITIVVFVVVLVDNDLADNAHWKMQTSVN